MSLMAELGVAEEGAGLSAGGTSSAPSNATPTPSARMYIIAYQILKEGVLNFRMIKFS